MPSSPKTPVNTALAAPRVRSITLLQPLQWLALGWRDMAHCGWISFAHGLVLALLGWAILLLAHDRVWLLAGAFSGFLVIAPALAARGWMLTSAAFVTLFTPAPVNSPLEFVRHVMLAEDGLCLSCGWVWAVCWPRPCLPPAQWRFRCCLGSNSRSKNKSCILL